MPKERKTPAAPKRRYVRFTRWRFFALLEESGKIRLRQIWEKKRRSGPGCGAGVTAVTAGMGSDALGGEGGDAYIALNLTAAGGEYGWFS